MLQKEVDSATRTSRPTTLRFGLLLDRAASEQKQKDEKASAEAAKMLKSATTLVKAHAPASAAQTKDAQVRQVYESLKVMHAQGIYDDFPLLQSWAAAIVDKPAR